MKQEFERIAARLYRRTYETADGAESVLFYARFVCKLKGKRRLFALGGDLKQAKDSLKDLDYRNRHREDFDSAKVKKDSAGEQKPQPMTVKEWVGHYLAREETKKKRSYGRDCQLVKPLIRLLGDIALVDLGHDDLTEYSDSREREFVIRNGEASKVKVKLGTIANELSCLRAMLNVALLCKDKKVKDPNGIKRRQYPGLEGFTINVSFKGLITRSQRERIVEHDEEKTLLDAYPAWLRRVAIFAVETCLSQGDVVRLTKEMVDRKQNEIVPANGRLKTGVEQRAPLTERALEVLDEIDRERRAGKIVANVNGLVFTRDDGRAVTRDMITAAIKTARRRTGVKDFTFHDYRHTAQTRWARQGVHVDVAMKAAGHKSVAMHQRYVNLKPGDVAAAFGLDNGQKMVDKNGRQNHLPKSPANVSA